METVSAKLDIHFSVRNTAFQTYPMYMQMQRCSKSVQWHSLVTRASYGAYACIEVDICMVFGIKCTDNITKRIGFHGS